MRLLRVIQNTSGTMTLEYLVERENDAFRIRIACSPEIVNGLLDSSGQPEGSSK
jgi:hypothetical protein